MRRFASLFVAASLILASGCTGVYAPKPVGEKPAILKPAEWDGTWHFKDGTFAVQVIDKEKGLLEVAGIGKDEKGFKLRKAQVHIMKCGEWLMASMKANEEKPERYFWGRIKRSEEQAVFWAPDPKKFKKLIEKKELPGRIDGADVILGELNAEYLKRLAAEDGEVLYHWDSPGIFIRLKKVD